MEKLAQFLEPEKLNQVLELGKKIWDDIGKLYNYHSSAGDHVNNLKRKWKELECQKTDIEEKMKSELFLGKRPKREVELWLQEVETINGEIQTIEEEGGRGIWKYAQVCIWENLHARRYKRWKNFIKEVVLEIVW